MKKLIGFTMIAVMAGSLFAAEAAQYGWQKGAAANANRSAFFSKVGEYKTEAEREAAFAKAGIGENSPYKDSEHYDVEKLLADGAVGRIRSVQATNITLSPVWAFPWQGDPKASFGSVVPLRKGDPRFRGGALCDHPHVFDLIRHLTGSSFDYLYAEVAPNLRDGLKVEDMLMAVGKMKDGTAFLFDPSWSRLEEKIKVPGPGWERFPKRMEVNVTITGDKGMLSCDCFGPNVYHNGAPNDRYTVQYTYFDEWIGLIDEFVDCIRNHKTPLINLRWHRETIRAMLACYESIASGKIARI